MKLRVVFCALLLLGAAPDPYGNYVGTECVKLHDAPVYGRSFMGVDSDGELDLRCGRDVYRAAWVRW